MITYISEISNLYSRVFGFNFLQLLERANLGNINKVMIPNIDKNFLDIKVFPKKLDANLTEVMVKCPSLFEQEKMILEVSSIGSFSHEIVFNVLLNKRSDKRVGDFCVGFKGNSNKTPDYVCRIKNRIIIFELKTLATRDLVQINNLFQDTYDYYKPLLSEHSSELIVEIKILCVSIDHVSSNFKLSNTEASFLKGIYKASRGNSEILMHLGWSDSSDDQKVLIRKLKNSLAEIEQDFKEMRDTEDLIMTKESIEHFRSVTTENITSRISTMLEKSESEAANPEDIVRREIDKFNKENPSQHNLVSLSGIEIYNFIKNLKFNGRMDNKSPVQLPMFIPKKSSKKIDLKEFLEFTTSTSELNLIWKSAIENYFQEEERWEDISDEDHVRMMKGEEINSSVVSRWKRYRTKVFAEEQQNCLYKMKDRKFNKAKFSKTKDFSEGESNFLSEKSDISNKKDSSKIKLSHKKGEEEKIILDDRISQYLYKKGISAKKAKNMNFMSQHRRETQEGFSINVDISDIETFISRKDLFAPLLDDEVCFTRDDVVCSPEEVNLVKRTNNFVEGVKSSRLLVAQRILRYVLTEVNFSLKQNCKEREFILKKLEDINCVLLIKPSSKNEFISFSILTRTAYCFPKPFKEFVHLFDDWFSSDFVSMDVKRLSHQLVVPEKTIALCSMWASLFDEEEFFNSAQNLQGRDTIEHTLASVLFLMEDKEKTSADLQQIRYAYMEILKESRDFPNPLKILRKMSDIPRSRLQIWMYKQIIKCFEMQLLKPPIFGLHLDPDLGSYSSQDSMKGLISWVSLREIKSFEIALNLSYLGVLHNKEEENKSAGNKKIFDKIIKEERVLAEKSRKSFMGHSEIENEEDLISHEFSPSFLVAIAKCMRRFLIKELGSFKVLEEKILKTLSNKSMLELCTLKASAIPFDSEKSFHLDDRKSSKIRRNGMNKRFRVTEGMYSLIEKGIDKNPMLSIHHLYNLVKEQGGLQANLFKKLQIGGPREIFVLTPESRALVYFCETTCRTVCEEMPNEFLTKGKEKTSKNKEHLERVFQKGRDKHISITASDDATTWAQRFIMKVFGCFLSNLFEKEDYILMPLISILNMCTKKRLELPYELLEEFAKNKDLVDSFNPNLNELRDQFLGRSKENYLINKNGTTLKNKSNMMQGIFHYTSSLLHSAMTLFWSQLSVSIIRNRFSKVDVIETTKVSSDDSSAILTVCHDEGCDKEERGRIKNLLRALIILKRRMYPLMSCKQSDEKSTSGIFCGVEEFNSVWTIKNTVLTPVIKFICSSVQISQSSNIDNRMNEASNLRAQILENCGNSFMSSVVQLCQRNLHYISLGSLNYKNWKMIHEKIQTLKHPSFGYFPVENELISGVLGVDFLRFNIFHDYESSRLLELFLKEENEVLQNDENQPLFAIKFVMGNEIRFRNFLKRIGVDNVTEFYQDLEKSLDLNPEILYRPIQNSDELKIKIKLKSSSPDCSNAFKFLDMSTFFAAASYINEFRCLRMMKRKQFNEDKFSSSEKEVEGSSFDSKEEALLDTLLNKSKITFYQWLDYGENALRKIKMLEERTINMKISYLMDEFDCKNFYLDINSVLKTYDINFIEKFGAARRSFLKITLPKTRVEAPLSLQKTMSNLWFDSHQDLNVNQVEKTFFLYQQRLPWLQKSYSETIISGNFLSHRSLYSKINSLEDKSRTINLISAANEGSTILETLENIIKKSFLFKKICQVK